MKTNKWNDVDNKLPPVCKHIIVYGPKHGVGMQYFSLAHKNGTALHFKRCGITHWMELPSKPEKKLEDKNPYMLLKWGTFKGGDFNGNPEALLLVDKLHDAPDEDARKTIVCHIIDLFNGDIFIKWGNEGKVNKERAKEYVMTYKSEL